MDTKNYRQLLISIRDLLLGAGDERWGPRLQSWIAEFDVLAQDGKAESLLKHFERTRRSLAGMGSIGDLVLCKEAGHQVPDSDAEVEKLNTRLQNLVHLLFVTISDVLGEGR